MSTSTISAFADQSTPNVADVMAIDSGGVTKKLSLSNLFAKLRGLANVFTGLVTCSGGLKLNRNDGAGENLNIRAAASVAMIKLDDSDGNTLAWFESNGAGVLALQLFSTFTIVDQSGGALQLPSFSSGDIGCGNVNATGLSINGLGIISFAQAVTGSPYLSPPSTSINPSGSDGPGFWIRDNGDGTVTPMFWDGASNKEITTS